MKPARTPGERFAHLYQRGYTATAIARLYQVHEEVVKTALDQLGIDYPPGPRPKKPPKSKSAAAASMAGQYRAGATIYQIAEIFHCSPEYARQRLIRAGVDMRNPGSPRKSIAHFQAPRVQRIFCAQCDRQVLSNEAAACQSRFCKAKPQREGIARHEGAR